MSGTASRYRQRSAYLTEGEPVLLGPRAESRKFGTIVDPRHRECSISRCNIKRRSGQLGKTTTPGLHRGKLLLPQLTPRIDGCRASFSMVEDGGDHRLWYRKVVLHT